MIINVIGFAIPLFVGLMLLEYYVAKKNGLPYFNLYNSIANISVGIGERLSDVLISGLFYFIYDNIQKKYGLFQIESGFYIWILLFICTDFIWYWYHRLGHEINILWLAHIVHHQSEDFNTTVSARVTIFQALARTGFWCVLPLIGFKAEMITVMLLIHGLYPFFIHTRLIGKLGFLEYLFVTPSHHRVHHASNEKYLDKNYGDVLIIWDKLFGTFVKEEEEPVYGLTKPLRTYSFLWQHFHFFIELWLAVSSVKGIRNKLKMIFGSPDKVNSKLRLKAERLFSIHQSDEVIDKPLNKYVVWQMIILLIWLSGFIMFIHYFSVLAIISFSLITLLTLVNCGAIMEQKRWVFYLEFARLFVLLLMPLSTLSYWQIKLFIVLLITILLITYYNSVKKIYLTTVYK